MVDSPNVYLLLFFNKFWYTIFDVKCNCLSNGTNRLIEGIIFRCRAQFAIENARSAYERSWSL